MTRYQKMLHGSAKWIGYYRYNVDKFAKDYLQMYPISSYAHLYSIVGSRTKYIDTRKNNPRT